MQPIRVALTGSTVSEPVNELLAVVGRERSLAPDARGGRTAGDQPPGVTPRAALIVALVALGACAKAPPPATDPRPARDTHRRLRRPPLRSRSRSRSRRGLRSDP